MFVPVGIWVPTLLARRPSSLTNGVFNNCAVYLHIRCLYSNVVPVSGSIIELTACFNWSHCVTS